MCKRIGQKTRLPVLRLAASCRVRVARRRPRTGWRAADGREVEQPSTRSADEPYRGLLPPPVRARTDETPSVGAELSAQVYPTPGCRKARGRDRANVPA